MKQRDESTRDQSVVDEQIDRDDARIADERLEAVRAGTSPTIPADEVFRSFDL